MPRGDITTEAVLLDARASVFDVVLRNLRQSRENLRSSDGESAPARVLYEQTKVDLLDRLRGFLVAEDADLVALVERGIDREWTE